MIVQQVPAYKSIQREDHDKDLSELHGQRIFLLLSSKYLGRPSIHAQPIHFHQAIEHYQEMVNIFFEAGYVPAMWIYGSFRQKFHMWSPNSVLLMRIMPTL